MKKIVIKTVDGKSKRMTAEEYNKQFLPPKPVKYPKDEPDYRTYPNRFAGKRVSEINA